ncbi:MAG TPA: alpha/beta hydrolase [Mycobacteriales bacterium]|jgi:pimeloyl-ACP methyl ester carboxylesterase|nr:alpha/beta hydrolase [Mycobacteriales bacterium]
MRGDAFTAAVDGGQISGWVVGDGPPVVLLHGGPGLSFGYLDELADEIGNGFKVAAFQQRGIAPSMLDGPYDVTTHLADIRTVLDALGWSTAYVIGHSWGGHLALHVATAMPDRLLGVLCLDPLGGVGDGGEDIFSAELSARLPAGVRALATELEERAMAGEGSESDALDGLRLVWPAYFADWDAAPPMPDYGMSVAAYADAHDSLVAQLPDLEASLPAIEVPLGIVMGEKSPMPTEESGRRTAERIPGAWVEVVADAGHFPWTERPGCVRAALDRLAAG